MNAFTEYQLFVLEKGEVRCADVRKIFGEYFDGELPRSVAGRVAGHIEDCPRCQKFAATYRLTVELARELGSKPMPTDVQRRLRYNLNQRLGINLPNP